MENKLEYLAIKKERVIFIDFTRVQVQKQFNF